MSSQAELNNGVHVTPFCHVITYRSKEWCTRNVNLVMPCQQHKSEEEACTRHFGASSLARIERLKSGRNVDNYMSTSPRHLDLAQIERSKRDGTSILCVHITTASGLRHGR
jgi:hypothetical protein